MHLCTYAFVHYFAHSYVYTLTVDDVPSVRRQAPSRSEICRTLWHTSLYLCWHHWRTTSCWPCCSLPVHSTTSSSAPSSSFLHTTTTTTTKRQLRTRVQHLACGCAVSAFWQTEKKLISLELCKTASKFQRQTYGFRRWGVQRKSVQTAILLFLVARRCRSHSGNTFRILYFVPTPYSGKVVKRPSPTLNSIFMIQKLSWGLFTPKHKVAYFLLSHSVYLLLVLCLRQSGLRKHYVFGLSVRSSVRPFVCY